MRLTKRRTAPASRGRLPRRCLFWARPKCAELGEATPNAARGDPLPLQLFRSDPGAGR